MSKHAFKVGSIARVLWDLCHPDEYMDQPKYAYEALNQLYAIGLLGPALTAPGEPPLSKSEVAELDSRVDRLAAGEEVEIDRRLAAFVRGFVYDTTLLTQAQDAFERAFADVVNGTSDAPPGRPVIVYQGDLNRLRDVAMTLLEEHPALIRCALPQED
jgi:hypothetical protein